MTNDGVRHERVVLVWNGRGGSAGAITRDEVEAKLRAYAGEAAVVELDEGLDLSRALATFLAGPPALVVAGGGDGTVSSVGALIARTHHVLGVLPLGTSNSVARALGLPLDPADALEGMCAGAHRTIDLARANDRTVVLTASLGLHARTVGFVSSEEKQRLGALAYVREALTALAEHTPFRVRLTCDGHPPFEMAASAVTIANAAPTRTWVAQGTGEVSPDDGLLDVTLFAVDGVLETMATGLELVRSALEGREAHRENIVSFRGRRVLAETLPAQPILLDGEIVGEGRLDVRIEPHALRVAVSAS